MMTKREQSWPAWKVGISGSLVLAMLAGCVLVVSFNAAQKPPLSESWDGPLHQMQTCQGAVGNWISGIQEHHERTADSAETSHGEPGAVSRFFTVILPWHWENRPLLLAIFAFCGTAILFDTYEMWKREMAGQPAPMPPSRH